MEKPVCGVVLRGVAAILFLVAAIVVLLSFQTVRVQSKPFAEKYFYWKGFALSATVNCIACIYNLAVVFIPPGSLLWRTIVLFDVAVNILVGGSLGAGWQTFELISEGHLATRWCPICDTFVSFCTKILAAHVVSSLGFLFSLALLVWTLHVSVDPFLVGDV